MSLDRLDADTREILARNRFDSAQFEQLRARVAAGELSAESNFVRGTLAPPPKEELVPLDGSTRDEGLAAFAAGEVAVCVLNGGMATRFGGVVKGIVEAVDGVSFLEVKARDAAHAARATGSDVPFVVMNSFATDAATRSFVRERGVPDPLLFTQSVSLRLTPSGDLFFDDDGTASPYSPGHGDFLRAIRDTGALADLRERGIRFLMLSNVDNLGARPDPAVVGAHLRAGRAVTSEVAAKEPGDKGGSPTLVDGRTIVVEGFRYPPDFDQDTIRVFATNSFVLDLDALEREYPLTWFYVEKAVAGRTAVQLEQLVNEISSFVPTLYLEVPREGPRGRFFPVKTPDDLAAAREPLRELLSVSPFD